MRNGKQWGATQLLFQNHAMELHRIEVRAHGYCSVHHHEHKWNGFYVERGELLVKVWQPSKIQGKPDVLDETLLGPGDTTQVPPGVKHQFLAMSDNVVAFESYWAAALTEDIVRASVGGMSLTGV